MQETIRFELNGRNEEVLLDPTLTLLWVLRDQFGLTGTKYGCGLGFCGACTIIVNDQPVRSCSLTIGDVAGKSVLTIEGIATKERIHPLQDAFMKHDAMQCGYCTPGMIMNAYGLLIQNPDLSEQEIKLGMENNLCRCGAHVRIIAAIESAASEMKGGK